MSPGLLRWELGTLGEAAVSDEGQAGQLGR